MLTSSLNRGFQFARTRPSLMVVLLCACICGGIFISNYNANNNTVSVEEKPNIILINLDDADAELLSAENLSARFPNLEMLANRGLCFTNTHATTPLCGPSRACLLRGQYAHNTGIRVNEPAAPEANGMTGGIRLYRDQGFFDDDLSTWMQDAGYRTMMVGKFLHGDFVNTVPQGWDDFYAHMGCRYYEFYRMTNELPHGKWNVSDPGVYRTNLETDQTISLLQAHADRKSKQPFFLYLNPLAPHNGAENEPMIDVDRYSDTWSQASLPKSANYDEPDIDDKSREFGDLALISHSWKVYMRGHYRDRLRATLSVDDQLGAIVEKLKELDELENTYIFVTSDNGFSLGQNRVFGKGHHFDHGSRIPLLVAGPGISNDCKNHLLAHIDLAPTIVDLAGGTVPDAVDGTSFKPLLDDPNSVAEDAWRDAILIENWETKSILGQQVLCASNTLRGYDTVYSELPSGDYEYYRLLDDPLQLENSYSSLSTVDRSKLAMQLRLLKTDGTPQIGISYPQAAAETFKAGVQLQGLVDAPQGVDSVRIALRDTATGRYWDGMQWQEGFGQVDAFIKKRTGLVTTWSYAFEPSKDQLPEGLVSFWSWGYDQIGQYTSPATLSFNLEAGEPKSTILVPRALDAMTGEFTIRGTAFSSEQADLVRLVVRRKADGEYWNGSEFQSDWTFHPSPVEADGSWSYSIDLDSGDYFVVSTAVDKSGTCETKPVINLFHVQ